MSIRKSGRELRRSIGSLASDFPSSNFVPARIASSPPAEKPITPTRAGSMPHSPARLRARRTARRASAKRMNVDLVARPFLVREPVLEHQPRHPLPREPTGDIVALVVDRKITMAASRADHNGRAGGLVLGREKHGQRWLVDARNPAMARLALARLGDLFRRLFAVLSRSSLRPERHHIGLIGQCQARHQQHGQEQPSEPSWRLSPTTKGGTRRAGSASHAQDSMPVPSRMEEWLCVRDNSLDRGATSLILGGSPHGCNRFAARSRPDSSTQRPPRLGLLMTGALPACYILVEHPTRESGSTAIDCCEGDPANGPFSHAFELRS